MKFELNIGLNVAADMNSKADINARVGMALRLVRARFGNGVSFIRRYESEYVDPTGKIVLESGLFVAVDTVRVKANWIVYSAVEVIAAALEQDCIAVYFPDAAFGKLVGPKASAWGSFNLAYFKRFESEVV